MTTDRERRRLRYITLVILFAIQTTVIVIFAVFVRRDANHQLETVSTFHDVHIMVVGGYGFLVTFLRRYGYSGIGFNFLLSAVFNQVIFLLNGFLNMDSSHTIYLTVNRLIKADIETIAVLVTFGAILGNISLNQLILLGVAESFSFMLNKYILRDHLKVVDKGSSMTVHMFGSYFGLAVSFIFSRQSGAVMRKMQRVRNSYNNDLFVFAGTLWLWAFWPSINGYDEDLAEDYRAYMNTYLALLGSCVASYMISSLITPGLKFNIQHIHNSTLAGGVVIGCVCNLVLNPYISLILGMVGGAVSVLGFTFVSPWLRRHHLYDARGVNNVHGLPAIVSVIASCILIMVHDDGEYGKELKIVFPAIYYDKRAKWLQVVMQIAGAGTTIAVAIICGTCVGLILRSSMRNLSKEELFSDEFNWSIREDSGLARTAHVSEMDLEAAVRRLEEQKLEPLVKMPEEDAPKATPSSTSRSWSPMGYFFSSPNN